ncbi:MAG: DUF3006 domain-containing protein [Clostridiales bacterium]|nr:DUF3006 domain-containing protein [Clostridiales bacterium]
MIIDRFEGNTAICEVTEAHFIHVDRGLLPAGAKEGDALTIIEGRFAVDQAQTARQRARARGKMDRLFQKPRPPAQG